MKQILSWFFITLLVSGCQSNPPKEKSLPSSSGISTATAKSSEPKLCEKCVTLGNRASLKKALVIGNSQYEHQGLNNPVNDATDMANLLADDMGFHVIRALNLDYGEMKKVIDDFRELLASTPDKSEEKVGLFYYSGHGARSNQDKNYLLPINNGKIRGNYELRRQAIQVKSEIVAPLEKANNGVNIIVADACRDNPYEGSGKGSNKRGLIPISPSSATPQKMGAVVAFAASAGEVADDGTQRNGLYTKHLLAKMKELKHERIESVFKKVYEPVVRESNQEQHPSYASSLTTDYCVGGCQ